MKTYARVEDGTVLELIKVSDDQTVESLYHPDFARLLVDVTGVKPDPREGWVMGSKGKFEAPVPKQPTPAEIVAGNAMVRDELLSAASLAIAPLQDAVDLGIATEDEAARLKLWKEYRVQVGRVDLTQQAPDWGVKPAYSLSLDNADTAAS
jgi:hypothetical protein